MAWCCRWSKPYIIYLRCFAGDNMTNFGDFLRELQSVKNFFEGTTVIASQSCALYPNLRP